MVRTRTGMQFSIRMSSRVSICDVYAYAYVYVRVFEVGAHGEVDNGRVLLDILLRVLAEALDVDDQVLWQLRDHVLAAVAVHHLLERGSVELRQAGKERHLHARSVR